METAEKIQQYCKQLRLSYIRNHYMKEVEEAVKAKRSYQEFLLLILERQVIERTDNTINKAIRTAGFPSIKRLEEYDFSFQPRLDEKHIRELAHLEFMEKGENIVFLGPPGVGKTHLAVALGIKACQAGKKVKCYTSEQLIQEMTLAQATGNLQKQLETLMRTDLLIIDELGYLELGNQTAMLFFRLISQRYEKGSIIITSNKPFEEWGQVFGDEVIAGAILDRLLHHCHPFFIQGKSYRMKNIWTKTEAG